MASRAILLDIEGTTTPIDFVTRVLFPYARVRIKSFVQDHLDEIQSDLERLKVERQADLNQGNPVPEGDADYLLWLMELDRKSTALKSLQGKIWQFGFESGELVGEFYDDVLPNIRAWKSKGCRVFIFSSGSVLAQKLIFRFSKYGDLSTLIDGYFDTETGPKREASSYQKIAESMNLEPSQVTFLSDVQQEIDAARNAGMNGFLISRNDPKGIQSFHGLIT